MKAYYILGHNVAWLNGICLILFVIGVVGALAMVAIPEKFNLRVNRGDTFIYCALIAVVGFSGMFVISIHSFSMDELEAGRHWKDDCKTLEVNMPTGAFTSPVNNWTVMASSLMCLVGGIIRISISGNYIKLTQNEMLIKKLSLTVRK